MSKITLGVFIASKLQGGTVKEWDMAPQSFDFEIRHSEADGPSDSFLLSLVDEFFRSTNVKHEVSTDLIGPVSLDGRDYLLCITNVTRFKKVNGTLKLV